MVLEGVSGSPSFRADPPVSSETLAQEWGPYAEEGITLFGAARVMFDSNLPTDGTGASGTGCNAYQGITGGCSESEKRAILAVTAGLGVRIGRDHRHDVGDLIDRPVNTITLPADDGAFSDVEDRMGRVCGDYADCFSQ